MSDDEDLAPYADVIEFKVNLNKMLYRIRELKGVDTNSLDLAGHTFDGAWALLLMALPSYPKALKAMIRDLTRRGEVQ